LNASKDSKLFVKVTTYLVLVHNNTDNKTGNVRIKVTLEAFLQNHCYHGKAISITYCECVSVALVIQHAKRMRRIILSSVACLAVPYFFHIIS
jgi:hypothetical protein